MKKTTPGVITVGRNLRREGRTKWEAHIRKWEHSGMSRSAYCRQQGLHISSFCVAVKRLSEQPAPRQDEFVEVRPVRRQEEQPSWNVEICFPNGVQVRASEGISVAYLAELIELGRI